MTAANDENAVVIINRSKVEGISENEQQTSSWKFWKRRRDIVAVLVFWGFFNTYALRVNLSMAIVAMTENKSVTHENGTVTYEQEFDWDSRTQGIVLSSFFYGYLTTQLLGGWLSARYGGKKVFGSGIAVTGVFTLLTPWVVYTNVYLFIAIRIIEGVFEGVTYPSIHGVWSRWAPPLERSRLSGIGFAGSYIGTVVAMPASAYLAQAFGWPSVFYVFGLLAVVWFVVWWIVVAESPADDPRITKAELVYIQESLGNIDYSKKISHPWRKIFTSLPLYTCIVAHFCENWGFYTMLTQLPKFMKDILDFDLAKTGVMSGLPYLAMSVMLFISGYFADWFQIKGILTTTQVRKVFNCTAFLSQALFMIVATWWLTPAGATISLTLAVSLGALSWSGFIVNYLDIAPQHASVMMGFGNTFATIPGIVSPMLSGYIVTTPTADEWKIVFYIAAGIYLVGCIFYGVFANAELQPWATEPEDAAEIKKNKKNGNGRDNKVFQMEED